MFSGICPRCLGNKVVVNPLWIQFWEYFGDDAFTLSCSHVRAFFRDRLGFSGGGFPSQLVDCPECGGAGVVSTDWLSVSRC